MKNSNLYKKLKFEVVETILVNSEIHIAKLGEVIYIEKDILDYIGLSRLIEENQDNHLFSSMNLPKHPLTAKSNNQTSISKFENNEISKTLKSLNRSDNKESSEELNSKLVLNNNNSNINENKNDNIIKSLKLFSKSSTLIQYKNRFKSNTQSVLNNNLTTSFKENTINNNKNNSKTKNISRKTQSNNSSRHFMRKKSYTPYKYSDKEVYEDIPESLINNEEMLVFILNGEVLFTNYHKSFKKKFIFTHEKDKRILENLYKTESNSGSKSNTDNDSISKSPFKKTNNKDLEYIGVKRNNKDIIISNRDEVIKRKSRFSDLETNKEDKKFDRNNIKKISTPDIDRKDKNNLFCILNVKFIIEKNEDTKANLLRKLFKNRYRRNSLNHKLINTEFNNNIKKRIVHNKTSIKNLNKKEEELVTEFKHNYIHDKDFDNNVNNNRFLTLGRIKEKDDSYSNESYSKEKRSLTLDSSNIITDSLNYSRSSCFSINKTKTKIDLYKRMRTYFKRSFGELSDLSTNNKDRINNGKEFKILGNKKNKLSFKDKRSDQNKVIYKSLNKTDLKDLSNNSKHTTNKLVFNSSSSNKSSKSSIIIANNSQEEENTINYKRQSFISNISSNRSIQQDSLKKNKINNLKVAFANVDISTRSKSVTKQDALMNNLFRKVNANTKSHDCFEKINSTNHYPQNFNFNNEILNNLNASSKTGNLIANPKDSGIKSNNNTRKPNVRPLTEIHSNLIEKLKQEVFINSLSSRRRSYKINTLISQQKSILKNKFKKEIPETIDFQTNNKANNEIKDNKNNNNNNSPNAKSRKSYTSISSDKDMTKRNRQKTKKSQNSIISSNHSNHSNNNNNNITNTLTIRSKKISFDEDVKIPQRNFSRTLNRRTTSKAKLLELMKEGKIEDPENDASEKKLFMKVDVNMEEKVSRIRDYFLLRTGENYPEFRNDKEVFTQR